MQTFADYSYDNIGNIKHAEYRYDSVPYTFVDYNYDRYNQLKKEVHSPLSMGIDLRSAEYAYDEFGNITDVTRTDSSGKVTKNRYVYSDNAGWQDLLTIYNGRTITYDAIGNPLSYYNGWTYTLRWNAGRRLSRSSAGGIYVDYSYNKDGIRTKKTVSNKYTDRYILDGDKLVGLERTRKGSTVKDTYYFIYDEMGTIWEAICYVGGATEPVRYFYRTNAQGDVKQIVDKDNNVIAYYDYDAWGGQLAVYDGNDKSVSGDSHFANVNPFRYRGYVYDNETGFYYLQSRYYDPEIGGFINADGYVSTDSSIISMNMYAYCFNNPIVYFDDNGECPYNGTKSDFIRMEHGLPSMDCICQISKVNEVTEIFDVPPQYEEERRIYGDKPRLHVSIETEEYAKLSEEEEESFSDMMQKRIAYVSSINMTNKQMNDFIGEMRLHIYGSYTSIDSVQESCEYADIDIRWDGEVIDMRGAVNFASKLFTKNDH